MRYVIDKIQLFNFSKNNEYMFMDEIVTMLEL